MVEDQHREQLVFTPVISPPQCDNNGGEIGSPTFSESTAAEPDVTSSEQEVLEGAIFLQDSFVDLLEEVRRYLTKIRDVGSLQLRLNFHLARARENTAAVKEVLTEIGRIEAPNEILNCLIRCDLIGYLNYRLLDVFQKLIREPQLDQLVQAYEDAVKRFLKSTNLGTLAQVFVSNPTVAPVTFTGLPRFTVHLNDSWEGRSWYSWDYLLRIRFHWPPHIQIVHLSRKCIIIDYGVLPSFAPDVVRDLTNPQVFLLLKEQGATEIELSDQLKQIAKSAAEEESPPFHLSAMIGDCVAMNLFIEYGADIDMEDSYGRSPLHLAAKKGENEAVELLLKAGANIHKTDKNGWTILHHAVDGNVDTVALLLNNGAIADINKKNQFLRTPIHRASEKGCDEIVTLFVKSGADVNEQDGSVGNTPLHLAATWGKKTTIELLLSFHADYTIRNVYGQNILHSAAEGGNIEIVEIFLKLCDTSYLHSESNSSIFNYTPLHCAVNHGHVEIVKLLLKSGADPNIGGETGRTSLHVAVEKGHEKIAKLLLKAGANPNIVACYSSEDKKCTILLYAIQERLDSMVELLLKYGANVNEKDCVKMRTPLHYAVERHNENAMKILLKYGANINEKDGKSGFTPLHLAVGAEENVISHFIHFDSVRFLLNKGANVHEQDNYGHTPLYYATVKKVVQLLLQFRASKAKDHQKLLAIDESLLSTILDSPLSECATPEDLLLTGASGTSTKQDSSSTSSQVRPTILSPSQDILAEAAKPKPQTTTEQDPSIVWSKDSESSGNRCSVM